MGPFYDNCSGAIAPYARREWPASSPLQGSALQLAKGAPAAALGAHLQTKPNLGGRFASGLLLMPPADRERPGLLDRVEVLIELKVGLAVVIHQAITPWLVATADRQGGGHRF